MAEKGKVIAPTVEDMIKALKACATDEPQNEYPCESCYLYPLSRDGRMSTGRTCFEHLVLDVASRLEERRENTKRFAVKLRAGDLGKGTAVIELQHRLGLVKSDYVELYTDGDAVVVRKLEPGEKEMQNEK